MLAPPIRLDPTGEATAANLTVRVGTGYAEIALDGDGKATLDAGGSGSVVTVTAPGAVEQGLTIVGSGSDHQNIDSGVQLKKGATGALVQNNVLLGNLYGIDIHGARDAIVRSNVIEGRQDRRMNDRGNDRGDRRL